LDDDIIFGNRYFENMLRVVSEGHLATRNGRFLDGDLNEYDWRRNWAEGPVDTFNEDDSYDFGGHIWAGKLEWLRIAWQHPSLVLYNAVDFWISAVLQHALGITTKRPRCPSPAKGLGVLPLFPIFRHFFHFHKNPSSSVISGAFSRENRFLPKPKKRPKIAKHTKHEPLPERDAISVKFP
jgi:hypothetical protein